MFFLSAAGEKHHTAAFPGYTVNLPSGQFWVKFYVTKWHKGADLWVLFCNSVREEWRQDAIRGWKTLHVKIYRQYFTSLSVGENVQSDQFDDSR